MSIFLLKNTVNDRTKATQLRSAAGLTEVINIGGVRLDPGMQMYIDGVHFFRIRENLIKHYQDGALEVMEVGLKEGVEIRLLAPERTPTPHVNPHGEYNPEAQKTPSLIAVPKDSDAVGFTQRPAPGVPPLPDPVPGADLSSASTPHYIQPEIQEPVPARPLVEQAILPGEISPREAHVAVPGEPGPGTQPIESVKEVSGPDAPTPAPVAPTPEESKPRLPDSPGGGTPPVKKKKLM